MRQEQCPVDRSGGIGSLLVVRQWGHHAEVEQDLAVRWILILGGTCWIEIARGVRSPGRYERHGLHVQVALTVAHNCGWSIYLDVPISGVGHRLVSEVADRDIGDDLAGAGQLAVAVNQFLVCAHGVYAASVEPAFQRGGESIVGRQCRAGCLLRTLCLSGRGCLFVCSGDDRGRQGSGGRAHARNVAVGFSLCDALDRGELGGCGCGVCRADRGQHQAAAQ